MGSGSAAEEPLFQGRLRAGFAILCCCCVLCTETSTVKTHERKEKRSQMTCTFVMKSTVQMKRDAKVVLVMISYNAELSLH